MAYKFLTDYLDEAVARTPDKVAIVDRFRRLTYRQLAEESWRVACGFVEMGVQPGAVVSFQLPNWSQFVVVHVACTRIGAVSNPIIPIYRAREVTFILQFAESKLIVAPQAFRGFNHAEMLAEMRRELPALKHALAIGEDLPFGLKSWDEFSHIAWEKRVSRSTIESLKPQPDDVTELIFTSGTTGEPKGVLHTHNTLTADILAAGDALGLTEEEVIFMPSTFGHQTGFLIGARMPIILGGTGVCMDIWNPQEAVELIARERASFTMGATPFLMDLINAPNLAQHDVSSLRTFVCAGAPIPRKLVLDAHERLPNCFVSAGWGMTEVGLVTLNKRDDRLEKVAGTDGHPIPPMEVRVVDAQERLLPTDSEGELQARGSFAFVGYFKRPQFTAEGFSADGFFRTGDRAILDKDGYIRISGRSKDIIIRGGENLSPAEVEQILFTHPNIVNVAIVGMPDPRLGERACACVIVRPGEMFTFDEMIRFLTDAGIAKQKFPERLDIMESFPMTASGKIQKYLLRQMVAARAS